jgi:hypothetical protein
MTKNNIFTMRIELLNQSRARLLSGDTALLPALNALKDDADDALMVTPMSVTDKPEPPPSGDKHDYMSLGPYWWPDPSKVDGLPYIRRDGEINPESLGDNTDRERCSKTMSAIETLSLAFFFTGNSAYADKAIVLLRHWFLSPATRMNPHLQFGQAIPGRVEGRDIGIIDTRYLASIVDVIGLLDGAPTLNDDDITGITEWMNDFLNWLLTSNHGKGESSQHNNHGTWYDVQTASLACFTGRFDIAKQIIAGSAKKRIDAHIAADGSQPPELTRTRSWDYSVMNLDGLCRLAELGRHVGVDLWHHTTPDGASLQTAIDFMANYINNEWPWQQIHEINYCASLPWQLRRASYIFNVNHYEEIMAQLPANVIGKHRVQLIYPFQKR